MTATHPYEVFALRGMLAVPYFEKALYELPEDQLSVEVLLALADKVEADLQGGLSPRPLLSVRPAGDRHCPMHVLYSMFDTCYGGRIRLKHLVVCGNVNV